VTLGSGVQLAAARTGGCSRRTTSTSRSQAVLAGCV